MRMVAPVAWAASLLGLGAMSSCTKSEPSPRAPVAAAENQHAPNTELLNAVGANAIDIVSHSDRVLFGELERVPVDDAALPSSLADSDRVAGYPVRSGLSVLDSGAASSAARAFLDWDNYDPSWRSRCLIERIFGFRFIRGNERVDVTLSDPCWLALWTFQRNGEFERWAAAFHVVVGPKLVGVE